MKEAMENLDTLKNELAEFFCEDPKSFKIEDCFKSLSSFCSKFKQAVGDNAKRREQEALAEQRRLAREAEELKKRNNGKNQTFLEKQITANKIRLLLTNMAEWILCNFIKFKKLHCTLRTIHNA